MDSCATPKNGPCAKKYVVRKVARVHERLDRVVNCGDALGDLSRKVAQLIQKAAAIAANRRERLQREQHRGERARHHRAFFIGEGQSDAVRRDFFDGSIRAAGNRQSAQAEARFQILGGLQDFRGVARASNQHGLAGQREQLRKQRDFGCGNGARFFARQNGPTGRRGLGQIKTRAAADENPFDILAGASR